MTCLKVKLDRGYRAIVFDIKGDKSECQLEISGSESA